MEATDWNTPSEEGFGPKGGVKMSCTSTNTDSAWNGFSSKNYSSWRGFGAECAWGQTGVTPWQGCGFKPAPDGCAAVDSPPNWTDVSFDDSTWQRGAALKLPGSNAIQDNYDIFAPGDPDKYVKGSQCWLLRANPNWK